MASTTMNWIDQSWFDQETTPVEYDNKTLFFTMFTADKGPETLGRCSGDTFYKLFGRNLSFEKHGQPLLQAKKIIDAGGELLYQRFVSSDATLSNIIVVATVTKKEVQRQDESGNPLYIDANTGDPTTNDDGGTNLPLNDVSAVIRYDLQTTQNAKSFDEVYAAAEALYDDGNGVYPIMVVGDIGRNADCKRLAFYPDYETSKSLGYLFYTFKEFENTTSEDSASVTMNPNIIYRNTSYAINRHMMTSLTLDQIKGCFEAFAKKVADYSGQDYDTILNADLLFGKDIKGKALTGVELDTDGTDLSYTYGIELKSGSDGSSYGETPFTSTTLADDMVKYMEGAGDQGTSEIFDRDVHKITAILDANYPKKVKEAIATFVNFREDCFYFRDYGTDITNYSQIVKYQEDLTLSRFIGDYITTYQVYDPYTDKRIRVTMIYGLVEGLVTTMQSSPTKPFAGIVNGFTITEAIQGTVNYIPRVTPVIDQKDQLKDLKVNYATYYEYDGPLVVDSLYTSQPKMSQLSYINNVIGIQEVMRAVRTECPKTRFTFVTDDDFTDYQEVVNRVLANFKSNFRTLKMIYTQDSVRAAQKIFYASIVFQFNNWAESEIFDLYALGNDEVVE